MTPQRQSPQVIALDGANTTPAGQSGQRPHELLDELPNDLREILSDARNVVVFSGAGMSKDSGLDTFRDAQTGIWQQINPQDMASIDSWARDPEPMFAWYLWRAHICDNADPNPGHHAIAEWETADWAQEKGINLHVVTQNVDNLHERAGTKRINHLHGSLHRYNCSICHKPAKTPDFPAEQLERVTPPNCSLCGNPVRPGIVWFGEPLPPKDWDDSEAAMRRADVVVIVGTSGVVYPAAGLPAIAKQHGATLIEVSPDSTDLTPITDFSLRTSAAHGLPLIVAAAKNDAINN